MDRGFEASVAYRSPGPLAKYKMNKKNSWIRAAALTAGFLLSVTTATAQVAFTRMSEPVGGVRRVPETAAGRERGPGTPLFQPSVLSSSVPALLVESGPVSFGEVVAGEKQELTDALIVRVISNSDWELQLVQDTATIAGSRGAMVTTEMLEWKSPQSSRWNAVRPGAPFVVSRGRSTGPGGEVVPVDLRLRVSDRDPLGQYGFNLRLSLETSR